MTIIHSSDLGWTEGQDISEEFAALAKTLRPGDTFVFDHMYKISGNNIDIADGVTLAGGAAGAGFKIYDFTQNDKPLLVLGNSAALIDLTVTHEDVSTGASVNNGASIHAIGDDIKIINSSFSGAPKEFIRVSGDGFSVTDTVFDGAFYQMRWIGEATNFVVENTLFKNSDGDGIKTERSGGLGTENATISNSVFIDNYRDGIDTVGGFKNSLITDSYFIDNGVSALDLKVILEKDNDISPNIQNSGITINNVEMRGDQKNLIVTTLLNRNGTPDNIAEPNAPHDITVSNSIFENYSTDGGLANAWFVKDGYDFHSNNNQYLGDLRFTNEGAGSTLTQSGDVTGPPQTPRPDSYYLEMAGPDWSNISYPVDGTPTPPDSNASDPVVDTPGEVDSVVEEPIKADPVADIPEPVEASNHLDIFLAYTDTDETVSQLGDGSSVDSSLTDGRPLTIVATSRDDGVQIGSVKLTVDGVGSRVENVEPYALFGDDSKGNLFGGQTLPEGTYNAELVVFDGHNGSGNVLETATFEFTVDSAGSTPNVPPEEPVVETPVVEEPVVETPVVEEPVTVVAPEENLASDLAPQEPYSQFLDLQLVDTRTDKVLTDLHQGSKLSSSDLSGHRVTLSAETIDPNVNIGSVRLELDGQYSRVENVNPYALFGDNGRGNFFDGKQLADGTHSITLTVYSGKNGTGSVLEQVTVDFEVGDYDSIIIDESEHNISSYSEAQDTGKATVSSDQSVIELEGSAWKSVDLDEDITESTVLEFDFKSDAEGEIQGIGFVNEDGELETMFFQLDGSQELGIQDFNDGYETGSDYTSYSIPVGQYFTGSVQQLVLVNDDDANLGAMSAFSNIGLIDLIA